MSDPAQYDRSPVDEMVARFNEYAEMERLLLAYRQRFTIPGMVVWPQWNRLYSKLSKSERSKEDDK